MKLRFFVDLCDLLLPLAVASKFSQLRVCSQFVHTVSHSFNSLNFINFKWFLFSHVNKLEFNKLAN